MSDQVLKIAVKVDDNGSVTLRQIGGEAEKAGVQGEKGMKRLRKGIVDVDKKSLQLVKNLAKIGAAATAAAFVMIAKSAVQLASDMEEVQGKFDVVFRGLTEQAEQWSTTLVESYAMSELESKKYLSSLQDLIVPTGMARDAAGELSNKLVRMAADLASFGNYKTADVILDIQSALQGSSETMAKYGINVKASKVEQEILNSGLARSKKEITDAHKAQAIYNIMMREGADAVGDQQRTMGSYANQQKQLQANLMGLQVTIGQALLPTMTEIVTKTNEWLKENDDIGESVAELFKAIALGGTKAITTMAHVVDSIQVLSLVFASENVNFSDWLFGSPEDMQRILGDAKSGVLTLRGMRREAMEALEKLEDKRAIKGRNARNNAQKDLEKQIAAQKRLIGYYTNQINALNYNLKIHGNIKGKVEETGQAAKDLNSALGTTGSTVNNIDNSLQPVVDDFVEIAKARRQIRDIEINLMADGVDKDIARARVGFQDLVKDIRAAGVAAKLSEGEIDALIEKARQSNLDEVIGLTFDSIYGEYEEFKKKGGATLTAMDEMWDSHNRGIYNSFHDVVSRGLHGEFDDIEDAFAALANSIISTWLDTLATLATNSLLDALGLGGDTKLPGLGDLVGGISDFFSPSVMGEQIPGAAGGSSILAGLESAVGWLGEATGLWGEAATAAIEVTELSGAYMAANPLGSTLGATGTATTTSGAAGMGAWAGPAAIAAFGLYSMTTHGDNSPIKQFNDRGITAAHISAAGTTDGLTEMTDALAALTPGMARFSEASWDAASNTLVVADVFKQQFSSDSGVMEAATTMQAMRWDDVSQSWETVNNLLPLYLDTMDAAGLKTQAQVEAYADYLVAQGMDIALKDELITAYNMLHDETGGLADSVISSADEIANLTNSLGNYNMTTAQAAEVQRMAMEATSGVSGAMRQLIDYLQSLGVTEQHAGDIAAQLATAAGSLTEAQYSSLLATLGLTEGVGNMRRAMISAAGSVGGSVAAIQHAIRSINSGDISLHDYARSTPIQAHAAGYVFDRPVRWGNHLVGEAGTEVLAPEDMLRRIFNEATGGGGQPIVHVTVNAKIGERELTDISYDTASQVYKEQEAGKNQYVMEVV